MKSRLFAARADLVLISAFGLLKLLWRRNGAAWSLVGKLVEFSLVGSTGALGSLNPQRMVLLLLLLDGVLGWNRPREGQTAALLQKGQGGVGSAHPAVVGRAALHLVDSLGHGGQSGGGGVGVQVWG